jgi:hypothetical protein
VKSSYKTRQHQSSSNYVQNTITLTVLGKEEHWIWSHSDENLTDSFWGPSYPNTNIGNTDDCALMVSQLGTFWWQDSSCLTSTVQSKTVAPLCQHEHMASQTSPTLPPSTTLPSSTTLPPSTTTNPCPSGWEEFEAHCYMFSGKSTLNWENAENDCIHRGGHLASIHSRAEQDFVISISNRSSYTWLGGSDLALEVCKCF